MFSRQSPSPHYKRLMDQYRQLHTEGSKHLGLGPERTFPGDSLLPHVEAIKELVEQTGSEFILDYGCGKGAQYSMPIVDVGAGEKEMVVDYWDITGVHCYDPCYSPFSQLPEGKFDGVISTDVLEHCPEEDVPWVVDEMFSYAEKFLYTNVACYPALHHLPNGENAHCTIQSSEWWVKIFETAGARYPHVKWRALVVTATDEPETEQPKFIAHLIQGN